MAADAVSAMIDIEVIIAEEPNQGNVELLRTLLHFIFPAIVKIRRILLLPAGLGDVAALQTLNHNLPLLFGCPLYPCFSFHDVSLAEASTLSKSTTVRLILCWPVVSSFPA